ncbi:phage tail assembly chaperone [Gilliamella apicola]|uniref:phage tail assembly chaperone n=1 Tax=Gilliamella apicola TaxID=1196095 RepID=UPI000A33A1AB|nr:phage tail assembly chaperone [Gilliamella apicola]OTP93202.1 hypothetical protein B6D13_10705 [Gilliamella apicola]OTQ00174.1 hypothetical protein B6D07_10670 [Gilliamella apicola]OTQ31689.1 hypothetical protein B6D02_03510 [Gilliamella apicola]
MNLKQIITAKNAGFRTQSFEVTEWGITVTVREPLHTDFYRYIKTIEKLKNNKKLSEHDRDVGSIEAEATLFASILIDENGDCLFNVSNDTDMADLIKNYGPIHTRIVNKSIELIDLKNDPIKEAEKKSN